ncbi:MAG: hypothetical protein SFV52_07695 [Saprospiraceae bacterium]|nr:hypothetical protein [Saprospiraceae bacterium]
MNLIRLYQRTAGLFLALLFTVFSMGCNAYAWHKTDLKKMTGLQNKYLDVYLTYKTESDGTAYQSPNKQYWIMHVSQLDTSRIIGNVRRLSAKEVESVMSIKGTKEERLKEHHIVVYLHRAFAESLPENGVVTVPVKHIQQMKIYKVDAAGSVIASFFFTIGVVGGLVIVIALIGIATKGASCPFIYSETPGGRVLEGEIFSGATAPGLERHDWLPLKNMQPVNDSCRIVITNEVKEIQHTNLLELVAVDHPGGTTVLFDKNGHLHTLARPEAPVSALNNAGNNVLPLIAHQDSLIFLGTLEKQNPQAEENLFLSFKRPKNAAAAQLVINAKNSMWLDYAHILFLDEFGVYKSELIDATAQKSKAELEQWMLDQRLPLAVWLETSPGKWERAGWYNLSGPLALRSDVLSIDLSNLQTEDIHLRLNSGFLFWEIDYVGLSFSANQPVARQTIQASSAKDLNGINVLPAIAEDDEMYYDQALVGEEATVVFKAPAAPAPGLQRSWFLQAKGHYEILHDAPDYRPKRKDLQKFNEPGSYPVFAQQKWNALARQNWQFTQANPN